MGTDRDLLLKKALELIAKHSVTAYEIEQYTELTAVGVQKIINGDTKRPQGRTLETIISYITNKYERNLEESKTDYFTNNSPIYLEKEGVKITLEEAADFVAHNLEQARAVSEYLDLKLLKERELRVKERLEEMEIQVKYVQKND